MIVRLLIYVHTVTPFRQARGNVFGVVGRFDFASIVLLLKVFASHGDRAILGPDMTRIHDGVACVSCRVLVRRQKSILYYTPSFVTSSRDENLSFIHQCVEHRCFLMHA